MQVPHLMLQRHQLLSEFYTEERQLALDVACLRQHVTKAQNAEQRLWRMSCEESAEYRRSHEQILEFEAKVGGLQSSAPFPATPMDLAPRAEFLATEARTCQSELAAFDHLRATTAAKRAVSTREDLDALATNIRASAQENQAMQANQQMALAHLKALQAMAAGSTAQIFVRENAFYSLLRRLEEHESVALENVEAKAKAEVMLRSFSVELCKQESADAETPSLWSGRHAELQELELERTQLHQEICREQSRVL